MKLQGSLPVSDQIANILLERIHANYYTAEAGFPSESQLCKEFGVSRATVRTAISALVASGLLIKRPGIGTFLASKSRLESGLDQLELVLRLAKRQSLSTDVTDVSVEVVKAGEVLVSQLDVPEGTPLTSIRRTIIVDKQPVSYHIDYVPLQWLEPEQVKNSFGGSVLDLLRQKYIQHVYNAVTEITAVSAKKEICSHLRVPINMALILLRETLQDETGTAISYSENFFVPSLVCFRLVRHEVQNTFSEEKRK